MSHARLLLNLYHEFVLKRIFNSYFFTPNLLNLLGVWDFSLLGETLSCVFVQNRRDEHFGLALYVVHMACCVRLSLCLG